MTAFIIFINFFLTATEFSLTTEKGMTLINAGEYSRRVDFDKEADPRRVYINEYYIDTFPVSIGEYFCCVHNGICNEEPLRRIYEESREKNGNELENELFFIVKQRGYPMTWVNFDDAQTYCRFQGKRLPTESEWEKAARGDEAPASSEPRLRSWRIIETPWGWDPDPDHTYAMAYCSHVRKARDTSLKPGYFGVYNMQGPVREWTLDYYRRIFQRDFPTANPLCTKAIFDAYPEEYRWISRGYPGIVKGGFENPKEIVQISDTNSTYSGDKGYGNVGFRCVRSELNAPEDFNK